MTYNANGGRWGEYDELDDDDNSIDKHQTGFGEYHVSWTEPER